jgi:PTEN phosphatase family protein
VTTHIKKQRFLLCRKFILKMSKYEKFDNSGGDHDVIISATTTTEQVINYEETKNNGFMARKVDQLNFDHIEVSLDDTGEDNTEVLTRAKDFFLEHNDNFRLSWDDAAVQMDKDLQLDPSRPPIPGWNWEYIRWRLRRIVESLGFRALTMILIVIDLSVVIADLIQNPGVNASINSLQIIDLIITIWFVIELILRLVALTPAFFFTAWYNVVDFAVVLITFIIVVVAATGSGEWAEKLSIFTIFRFVRVARLIRLWTEKKQIETAARQMVSQNKRRYQQDGYDLDLTYVTNRVIATSFPSTGMLALYRNPIEKVAKFLNDKHPRKYRMYNLCSERTYEAHHFTGCSVERFMIDDHNVPTLEDMVRFAQSVKEWFKADPENVIVVHCKGGKGRTGTMICVWLVEAGVFTSATESLDYFGNRRTDTNVSKKFQGVRHYYTLPIFPENQLQIF